MKANLWEPLGMRDVTFFPSTRPDMKARMADMSERDAASGKVKHSTSPPIYLDGQGNEMTDCLGGQGSFTTAEEYIKVLKAVLDCDSEGEGKILSKASVDELFKPQLGEGSKATLNAVLQDEMVCCLPPSISLSLFSTTSNLALTVFADEQCNGRSVKHCAQRSCSCRRPPHGRWARRQESRDHGVGRLPESHLVD
jgi:hypothetical protein